MVCEYESEAGGSSQRGKELLGSAVQFDIIFAVAVILLGIRLPSYMRRMQMPFGERLVFVIGAFVILVSAWLAWRIIGMFIHFI